VRYDIYIYVVRLQRVNDRFTISHNHEVVNVETPVLNVGCFFGLNS
jgi:hypothetical protein